MEQYEAVNSIDLRMIFNNLAEDEEHIWFWAINFNALYQYDKKTSVVTRLSDFIITLDQITYSKVVNYRNKIICIPQCADNIAVYDLGSRSMRFIDLDVSVWNEASRKQGKCWGFVCHEEYLFLLGYWDSYILKFNMQTEQLEAVVDLYGNRDKSRNQVYFKQGLMDKEFLLVPSCIENTIFVIDIRTMTYQIHRINEYKHGFYSICRQGRDIWLTPKQNDPIIRWQREENRITVYDRYPQELDPAKDISFGLCVYCNGFLWAFPLRAKKAIRLDPRTGVMEPVHTVNRYFTGVAGENFDRQTYFSLEARDNKLLACAAPHREFLEYDCAEDKLTCYDYQTSVNDFNDFLISLKVLTGCYVNERELPLGEYLNCLSRNKLLPRNTDNNTNIGKEIHERIKALVTESRRR